MSYSSIDQAAHDQALVARVTSAVQKEAWNGAVKTSYMASQFRASPGYGGESLVWPVSINSEAAYESALAANNPNPGGDPAVITDQAITSAVQANWPPDPPEAA